MVSQDWSIEIANMELISQVVCHTLTSTWSQCVDYLSSFHHNQGGCLLMVVKTPHTIVATILPLSWAHCKKKSAHSWFNDNAIYECNKQENPYQENIAYVSGIHYYENEVKTTKSTKLQKNLVTILMTIT